MPAFSFKAKPSTVYHADNSVAYCYVKVPDPKRSHCDMSAFRSDGEFGGYANSDLFLSMVKAALKIQGIGAVIKLDQLPPGVTVEEGKFLWTVTIDLKTWRNSRVEA